MQKVTVKEVRGPLGKGERKFFAVVDEKGGEFTTFDTKVANITPGSVLEIEPEVTAKDGKTYINIKEWKLISEGTAIPAQASPADLATVKLEIDARARITALILAGDLASKDKIKVEEINTYASKFYAWLQGKPAQAPAKQQAKPARVAKTAEPEKTKDELEKELFGKGRDPESIKNLGDLFKACFDDFKMLPEAVVKELGYSNKTEITETPAEAYRIVISIRGNHE